MPLLDWLSVQMSVKKTRLQSACPGGLAAVFRNYWMITVLSLLLREKNYFILLYLLNYFCFQVLIKPERTPAPEVGPLLVLPPP